MSQDQVTPSEDHRRAFISTIFFGLILTDGLTAYVNRYVVSLGSPSFDSGFWLDQLESIIPIPPNELPISDALVNSLFFAVTFFWIVSHWIFYHDLIRRYPYHRWRKFFVDIAVFSIMFIALRLSLFVSDHDLIFPIYVSLIAIWYALCALWHFADRGLRPLRPYSDFLVGKSVVYFSIVLIFIAFGNSVIDRNGQIDAVLMVSVLVLMVVFNIERLSKYISKKEKVSNCCLFYTSNNSSDGSTVDPYSMPYQPSNPEPLRAYPPQMYVIELFRRCSEKIDRYGNKSDINIK